MNYFFPNTWENFTGNSASPLNHFYTLDYQRTTHYATNTTARIYHFREGANNEKTLPDNISHSQPVLFKEDVPMWHTLLSYLLFNSVLIHY